MIHASLPAGGGRAARTLILAASLVIAACGKGDASDPSGSGGPGETCKPDEVGAATPGDLEGEVTNALREIGAVQELFGDRTQELLDQADALRVDAAREAADQVGFPPPSEDPPRVGGLCLRQGLSVQAWVFRESCMAKAVASLPFLIEKVPFSGRIEGVGAREEPSIAAKYEIYIEGNGKSEVSAQVLGEMTITSATEGGLHETSEARASIDVCPDADGRANGKVHFSFTGLATPPTGTSWSYWAKMDSTFHLVVNDDAEMTGLVIESEMSYGSTRSNATEVSATGSLTMNGANKVTGYELDWQKQEGSLDAVNVVTKEIYNAALMAAVISSSDARKKWRDGTCVEIKTNREGGTVDVGEKVSLTATARQKLDSEDIDAKVQGWLDGAMKLEPNAQRLDSPATFEYTAGHVGEVGTVHLESVSKRGIGKKDLVFTANARGWSGTISWSMSGSTDSTVAKHNYHSGGDGGGSMEIVPGEGGTGTMGSAMANFTFSHTEDYSDAYEYVGCQHVVSETRSETATGTGSDGGFATVEGGGAFAARISASTPTGNISGQGHHESSDASTGPPQNKCQSSNVDEDYPYGFTIPQVTIQVDVPEPAGDYLGGKTTKQVSFGGVPFDFEVTYALSR